MRHHEPVNFDVRATMRSTSVDGCICYGRTTSPQCPIRFKGTASDTCHKLTEQPLSSVQ